jgi:hypothetical protein
MDKKITKGEVVWAKVKGFPWWPGVVASTTRGGDILVNFIGDESHAELPMSKVCKFESKSDEYSNTKHKGLLNSIRLAKKIHEGELSFDKHMNQKDSDDSSDESSDSESSSRTDIIENDRTLLRI